MPLPPDKSQLVVWDTETPGFGLVIGKTCRTFVVNARINGVLTREAIGVAGQHNADGDPWTVKLARAHAQKRLGGMRVGEASPAKAKRPIGPTLREAIALHVDNMRAGRNRRRKACSPRSIARFERDVPKHFAAWLDRPLVELTGLELKAICERIIATTKRRADAVNAPGVAHANSMVAAISAVWNAVRKLDKRALPDENPADAVGLAAIEARGARIPANGFAAWYAKVQTLVPPRFSAVRRDLYLFALFTGMRSGSACAVRWEHIREEDGVLHVKRTKGDRPYSIPLTTTMLDILEVRLRENAIEFKQWGGDQGWVFPALTRDRKRVQHVAEPKQREDDPDTGKRVTKLIGIQGCRRTYNSVGIEIGIPKEQRETLMNHEGRGVNIEAYGFPENWEFIRSCAERIEAALWDRIRGTVKVYTGTRRLRLTPEQQAVAV